MRTLQLSKREEQLLTAALCPNAIVAAKSWKDWASSVELEEAPYPELRLLTAVYHHLSRVAPALSLPGKLRGKARATFIQNHMLAHEAAPAIAEISRNDPLLIAKGLSLCLRFDAWSSRTMGDVDVHVPISSLAKVCAILNDFGWTPQYGMTRESLINRTALRRNSWNFTKGQSALDLHWRFSEGPLEEELTTEMWANAEPIRFFDSEINLPSPEFGLATALEHGFHSGTHADGLQCVVDCASLLPRCNADKLLPLLKKTRLTSAFHEMASVLDRLGHAEMLSKVLGQNRSRPSENAVRRHDARNQPAISPPKCESALLRRPLLYRLWERLGRTPRIERMFLRLGGPFSKPLSPSGVARPGYDLRDCATIDEIGGPGWGWPEPEHTCFWSDRADARLLVPLEKIADYFVILEVAEHRVSSPNASVDVHVSGHYLTTIQLNERKLTGQFCILVPRGCLIGPWLELSLRPRPYLGNGAKRLGEYANMRSIPAQYLRIIALERASEFFSGYSVPLRHLAILRGDEPEAGKFARIRAKIENSAFRNSTELPRDFDPVQYVLGHDDLFLHEVDPFEHFLTFGRQEKRLWK